MSIALLDIDHEMMGRVKLSLNNAITEAIRNLEEGNVATVSMKIEICMANEDDHMTQLKPIDFVYNVTTKKDVSKDKGWVDSMLVTESEFGFLASSGDGQVSIFEVMEDGD